MNTFRNYMPLILVAVVLVACGDNYPQIGNGIELSKLETTSDIPGFGKYDIGYKIVKYKNVGDAESELAKIGYTYTRDEPDRMNPQVLMVYAPSGQTLKDAVGVEMYDATLCVPKNIDGQRIIDVHGLPESWRKATEVMNHTFGNDEVLVVLHRFKRLK